MTESNDQILRVSNTSSPSALASAISHALYDSKKVTLRAIGAGAVNQAVKAIAIASGYVAQRGLSVSCKPGFETLFVGDQSVSAIVLRVTAD